MVDRRTINICLELVGILDKIRDKEYERTSVKPSYKNASKILVMRINRAGGLKE